MRDQKTVAFLLSALVGQKELCGNWGCTLLFEGEEWNTMQAEARCAHSPSRHSYSKKSKKMYRVESRQSVFKELLILM